MGIGAFCVMLLSLGAGPAAAIPPQPCYTCEPGETPPPTLSPAAACAVFLFNMMIDASDYRYVPATGSGPFAPYQEGDRENHLYRFVFQSHARMPRISGRAHLDVLRLLL